jgi:hypothetical protein
MSYTLPPVIIPIPMSTDSFKENQHRQSDMEICKSLPTQEQHSCLIKLQKKWEIEDAENAYADMVCGLIFIAILSALIGFVISIWRI